MFSEKKKIGKKKPLPPVVKNKKIYNPSFENFDPNTGEKTATLDPQKQRILANMEAGSEARNTRRSPYSKEETIKDAATGGSLSYLIGRTMSLKDSKKLKMLTSSRKHGILGLAAAGLAAGASVKKQKSDYNRQQGAREFMAGKETGRSSTYKDYLSKKYEVKDR